MATRTTAVTAQSVGDLSTLIPEWRRSLRAGNKSDKTVSVYMEAAGQLHAFLMASGMPTQVENIRREHIEAFIETLRDSGKSPATLHNRYRSLSSLFKWLTEDGEITVSPMAKMSPPMLPEQPVRVLDAEDVIAMLDTCKGTDFDDVRDDAVLRLFIDTGMRLAEMTNLTVNDIDLDERTAVVTGKGRRQRSCPFGDKAGKRLGKYMRMRARRADSSYTDALWLGTRGALTVAGVRALVERRAKQAGVKGMHAHLFRHFAAHHAMDNPNFGDNDVMRLFGWRSRDMLSRYASSTADKRALAAYRRQPSLGDRL
jgi:site-specific recombinase XerC